MPYGKGTYGSKVGRPPKKSPIQDAGWKHFAGTDFRSKEAKTRAIKSHNEAYGPHHTTHGEQNPKKDSPAQYNVLYENLAKKKSSAFKMKGFPQQSGVAGNQHTTPLKNVGDKAHNKKHETQYHTGKEGDYKWENIRKEDKHKDPIQTLLMKKEDEVKTDPFDKDLSKIDPVKKSPFEHLGSGTKPPNEKYHHEWYGPEGPIPGRAYKAVVKGPSGRPPHLPNETPTDKTTQPKDKKKNTDKKTKTKKKDHRSDFFVPTK